MLNQQAETQERSGMEDVQARHVEHAQMPAFVSVDQDATQRHGPTVLAVEMFSSDYDARFAALAHSQSMKEPRCYRDSRRGYLVVRYAGTPDACETWIARHVFLQQYRP